MKKSIDKQDNQRVYGKFNLEFDLEKIFSNIDAFRAEKDNLKRSQLLKSQTSNQIAMSRVDQNSP